MCGILGGFVSHISEALVRERLAAIRHRGPDGAGAFHQNEYFAAACRLAIRDPSADGGQPMISSNGRFVLCYNGELYNQEALREKLRALGFSFTTDTDTETLLCAWQAWGSNCLPMLRGIFAFAVYDTWEEMLFLARDPLGVKPLYVYQNGKDFLFTSEIKALLKWPSLDFSIKEERLHYFLVFLYLPGEPTLFQNIEKLKPGHFGIYKRKEHRFFIHRFYQLPFNGQYSNRTAEKEWAAQLEAQLLDTVAAQMTGDAGMGIALSGGLDSSLLAALAGKVAPERKIPCFTMGHTASLEQEGFGDDCSYAQTVAAHLQLDLEIVPGHLHLETELDRMVWHLEAPHGDPAAIHHLHLSEAAAARGLKVLLSGAGADDVFAGYRRHQALRWLFLKRLPAPLKNALVTAAGWKGAAVQRRVRKLLANDGQTPEEQLFASFFWLHPQTARNLFQQDLQSALTARDPFHFMRETLAEIPDEKHRLNQMLALELRLFMGCHNLDYLDKLGMAAGIEARVPYLDTDLLALSAAMPPALKLKGNTTKYLLKKVAAHYLPAEIIDRKKTGFAAPIRGMLTGPLTGFVRERLFEGSLRQKEIFNEKEIKRLVAANAAGAIDAAYPIFTLLAIESWLRQFSPA